MTGFLNQVAATVPKDLDVHLIGQLRHHKTDAVREWLIQNSRFHFHSTRRTPQG